MRVKSLQLCLTFAILWTRQTPLSMGFSRQEDWRGLPCPLGDLPDPGIEPTSVMSLALADGFFTTSATWEAWLRSTGLQLDGTERLSTDTHTHARTLCATHWMKERWTREHSHPRCSLHWSECTQTAPASQTSNFSFHLPGSNVNFSTMIKSQTGICI